MSLMMKIPKSQILVIGDPPIATIEFHGRDGLRTSAYVRIVADKSVQVTRKDHPVPPEMVQEYEMDMP